MTVDTDAVAAIIRDVSATEILPRYKTLEAHEVRTKSHPGDLVTAADEAAEAALSARLRSLLPGSVVVGEEGTAANPALLDLLSGDAPVWVLDPVDGTRNFAHGVPRFAVMVALVTAGETLGGWIYDPIADVLYSAKKGAGSWRDGHKIHVGDAPRLDAMVGATGYRHAKLFKPLGIRTRQSGSAAHDYMQASDGRIDFALFRRRLNPWDHAAGALIHQEAGGFGRTVDGKVYRPGDRTGDHLILAPDQATWALVRDIVLPHVRGEV